MRSHSMTATLCVSGVATAATLLAAGCSRAPEPSSTAPATPTTTATAPATAAPTPAPQGAVALSPGGVTTKVDVPPNATESQYGQACHAARLWLATQRHDPTTLVESYLKTLQTEGSTGPGTFDTTWAALTPAQQAGAIMAAYGAANGECE